MKYRFILLALISLWPWCVSGQKITKESLVSQGKKRTIYLYAPATAKTRQTAPLLILLHGSFHVGSSLADKWKDLAEREGFIIVAPNSIDSAVWAVPADGPAFMRDLVEHMKSRYSVDTRRVYLFGHSGGAVFALLMALYESKYFAGIAVHAGALNPSGIELIKIAKRKTPIHLQVGNMDPLFPVMVVRATRDALQAAGFPVELKEIRNHDHGYYDLAPKINQTAWDFLKQHSLSEEADYEEYNFGKLSQAVKDRDAAAAQYNRGMERLQAKDYAGAITAFTKSIEIDGGDANAFNNRGLAYLNQGNVEAALVDFTRSIEIKPTDAAHMNRGGILYGQKKVDEAIADFTEAIKLNPSAEAYTNRGMILVQSGKGEAGLVDYQRAIQINPNYGRPYILRGLWALDQGDAETARKDFDAGFKLDPALHAEFDALIQQLKTIRGIK